MNNTKMPRIIRQYQTAHAVSFDCDCACAAEIPSEKQYLMGIPSQADILQMAPKLHTQELSKEYYLAFLPMGNRTGESIAILNKAAWEMLVHFEHPCSISPHPDLWKVWGKPVVETTIENLLNLGFLTTTSTPQVILSEHSETLSAWLHLTDHCNLRCAYCYLPHTRAHMSATTGRAAIDAVFRSAVAHDYRTVKLKYAGGEPLLRFPLLLELHQHAHDLAKHHGLTLDGVVLSNGTLLTAKMVEQMQSIGLRLMISLDGIGPMHDCQRHDSDGQGSFAAVAQAINLVLSGGLTPEISITVSGRNASGLPETVAWVLERDLPFSINFYRGHTLSNHQPNLKLEEATIIEGMLAAYRVIEHNLPHRSLLASLADRANLAIPHLRTCSAGRDYMVVDTRGRIAKCQMTLTQTVTDCHHPDPLNIVRKSTTGLQNLKADEKNECRDCDWRYRCGGGCPLETYRVFGRYDIKSPNCAIYKTLYPEILRLEGLRLLKYQ